jgi:DNA (cytosine-5)-methyltransferase 1
MKKLKVGSDFSGVGAFNQALMRLGINYEEEFACDMDKYARDTFIHNYGEPKYYPTNVYDREIPSQSLDIYMTSPPCQAFSLAGKRLGKEDKRGILFFNSHEFIQVNKPRFFIFENVKGLLSDDNGRTFQEWVNMLGGKSVNGVPVLFPYEDSVPYHLYWQVLNAKHYGVPQNRERVFLIGIRDDGDNRFQFPREEHLTKRLKDVLEYDVDDKYFLSNDGIKNLIKNQEYNKYNPLDENSEFTNVITARCSKISNDNPFLKVADYRKDDGFRWIEDGSGQAIVMQLNQSTESGGKQPYQQNRVYDSNALCPALNAGQVTWGGNIVTLPNDYKIRRLTPRECFRLMDFPDTFTWKVSDSQAYKQAGNSIVVNVLYKILKQLPL